MGITPAYAGNTFPPDSGLDLSEDHPRLRGEYASPSPETAKKEGSPPLTRGILYGGTGGVYVKGITPAYAGNTVL